MSEEKNPAPSLSDQKDAADATISISVPPAKKAPKTASPATVKSDDRSAAEIVSEIIRDKRDAVDRAVLELDAAYLETWKDLDDSARLDRWRDYVAEAVAARVFNFKSRPIDCDIVDPRYQGERFDAKTVR